SRGLSPLDRVVSSGQFVLGVGPLLGRRRLAGGLLCGRPSGAFPRPRLDRGRHQDFCGSCLGRRRRVVRRRVVQSSGASLFPVLAWLNQAPAADRGRTPGHEAATPHSYTEMTMLKSRLAGRVLALPLAVLLAVGLLAPASSAQDRPGQGKQPDFI